MLYELTNFESLMIWSLSYLNFQIAQFIKCEEYGLYTTLEFEMSGNGSNYISPGQNTDKSVIGNERTHIEKFDYHELMFDRLGQCQVFWLAGTPFIIWQNSTHCLLYYMTPGYAQRASPKGGISSWCRHCYRKTKYIYHDENGIYLSDGYVSYKIQINDICPMDNLFEKFNLVELQPWIQDGWYVHLDNPNLISKFHLAHRSVVAQTIHLKQTTFNPDQTTIDFCPCQGVTTSNRHIFALSLYLDSGSVKTLNGHYTVPKHVISLTQIQALNSGLGIGCWYGAYYIYGMRHGRVLVPWSERHVKALSQNERDIVLTILLCVRQLQLQKWISMMLWKKIILPWVLA